MSKKEYIEREAILRAVDEATLTSAYIKEPDVYNDILDMVNEIPTADVREVRHGEWCHIGGDEWCCSCCGHVVSTGGSWEKPTKKYCSECGAKMDKE